MVPGAQPADALRQALRSIATAATSPPDELTMIEAAVAEGAADLVLVVDQFEECWTLAAAADRERFLGVLAQAVSRHVRCVVTFRADLYDRPLQDQLIGQLVADGTFALPPLTAEALEEAVVRPARRNGVEFDEGVATAIVAEASVHPAGLPLLQFALAELYEHRTDLRIGRTALRELGGIGGAVGRRAEETYRALAPELEIHARELFARLVAPGLGSPDDPAAGTARRTVRASSRSGRPVRPRATPRCRPRSRHPRAGRRGRPRGADHELAAPAGVAEHRSAMDLPAAASRESRREWGASGDTEGELYRGSRLEAVLEALPEHDDELNEEERAFVDASRRARDATRS